MQIKHLHENWQLGPRSSLQICVGAARATYETTEHLNGGESRKPESSDSLLSVWSCGWECYVGFIFDPGLWCTALRVEGA